MPKKTDKSKPELAEVHPIREVHPSVIEVLEEMLEQAKAGILTSFVACIDVCGEQNMVFMGDPNSPTKTLGQLELVKANIVDHAREMMYEEDEM